MTYDICGMNETYELCVLCIYSFSEPTCWPLAIDESMLHRDLCLGQYHDPTR